MAQGTIGLADIYPGFARGSGAAAPVTQAASGGAASSSPSGNAPAMAWLGVIGALVLVRVAYEMGAKVN